MRRILLSLICLAALQGLLAACSETGSMKDVKTSGSIEVEGGRIQK